MAARKRSRMTVGPVKVKRKAAPRLSDEDVRQAKARGKKPSQTMAKAKAAALRAARRAGGRISNADRDQINAAFKRRKKR